VLLAIDGSSCSDAAVQLVAGLAWPVGTSILVLAVEEPLPSSMVGLAPFPAALDGGGPDLTESLRSALADAVARLEAPGRGVESRLIQGRAGTVIVQQAERHHADLVVVGSRGLGPIGAMVMGSVSAEVVDHAPCAVLVARGTSVDRVLLAVDGSATSWRAIEHVSGLGYLSDKPFEVIAVEPRGPMPMPVMPGGIGDTTLADDAGLLGEAHRRAQTVAAQAAQRLGQDGIPAEWSVEVGDPALEIIRAARVRGCDLIAVGSRGQTGLRRLLVGSVARNVLMHAGTSVLVVREPVRRHAHRPDHAHRMAEIAMAASA
jgi:nucleotide-binding universal stress UspA family protein